MLRLLFVVVGILILASVPWSSASSEQLYPRTIALDDWEMQAINLEDPPPIDRLTERLQVLTIAIQQDNLDWQSFKQRGQIYRAAGHYLSAISDFTEALKLNPEDIDLYRLRGIAHLEAWLVQSTAVDGLHRHLNLAQADLDTAANRAPADARIFVPRGIVHHLRNDDKKADENFIWASRVEKYYAPSYFTRACLWKHDKDFAETYLTNAIKCDSSKWEYFYWRARLGGEPDEDFGRAIARTSPRPDLFFERAQLRHDSGQFREAEEDLMRVIELDSRHGEAHLLLADIYIQTDRKPEAVRVLEGFVKKDSGAYVAMYRLANIYLQAGRIDAARGAFQAVLDAPVGYGRFRRDARDQLARLDKVMEQGSDISPTEGGCFPDLASTVNELMEEWELCQQKTGQDAALFLARLQSFLDRNPENWSVWIARSRIHAFLKEYDAAFEDIDSALAISAVEEDIYRAKADIFLQMHEYDLARNEYLRLENLQSGLAERHYASAPAIEIHQPDGDRQGEVFPRLRSQAIPGSDLPQSLIVCDYYGQEATAENIAGSQHPDNVKAQGYFVLAMRAERLDSPEIVRLLSRAIQHDSSVAPYFWYRAIAREYHNELELVRQDYSRVIDLMPDAPGAYYHRARVCLQLGDLSGARADYDRLIELIPKHPGPLMARGRYFVRKERYDSAYVDYMMANQLAPEDPVVLFEFGIAALGQGYPLQAISNFERLIEVCTQDGVSVNNQIYSCEDLKNRAMGILTPLKMGSATGN